MFHKVIGCRSVYSHMNEPYVPEFCSFPQWGSHHYTRYWCRAAQSGHWDGEYGALRPLKAAPRTAAGSTFSRPSLEVSWSTDYIEPLETPLLTGYFSLSLSWKSQFLHFPAKLFCACHRCLLCLPLRISLTAPTMLSQAKTPPSSKIGCCWVNRFGRDLPKKKVFLRFPKRKESSTHDKWKHFSFFIGHLPHFKILSV